MADLERDLDRLLGGDNNVGLPAVEPAAVAAAPVSHTRWHLAVAAVLVIGVGVAVALSRMEEVRVRVPAAARKVAVVPARPAPAPARPSTALAGVESLPAGLIVTPAETQAPAKARNQKHASGGRSRPSQKTAPIGEGKLERRGGDLIFPAAPPPAAKSSATRDENGGRAR
jgi:hypothetical protein